MIKNSDFIYIFALIFLVLFISFGCYCYEGFRSKPKTVRTFRVKKKEKLANTKEDKLSHNSKRYSLNDLRNFWYIKMKNEFPNITKEQSNKNFDKKLNKYKNFMKAKNSISNPIKRK